VEQIERVTRSTEIANVLLAHANEVTDAVLFCFLARFNPPLAYVHCRLPDRMARRAVHAHPILEFVLERHEHVRWYVKRRLVAGANNHDGDADTEQRSSKRDGSFVTVTADDAQTT